MQTRKF